MDLSPPSEKYPRSRARFTPLLGRYISPDPIGFRGNAFNQYAYVSDNPESLTDPLGLEGVGNRMGGWNQSMINPHAGMSLFSFGEGAVDAWASMAHALVNTPEIPLAGGEDQDGLRPRPTRWITGPAAFDAARDESGSADPAAGCANKATARLNLGSTDSFGRGDLLGRHFEDHGAEVGATSAAEYAAAALEFLQQSQENGFPTLIGSNRSTRTYDPSTNYFAAFNADGTTKTFFTPTSPNYWNTQEGSQPTIIGGP